MNIFDSSTRWSKAFIFITFFFVSFCLQAYDYTISYDDEYFNPLAVSFKWKVKINKVLDKKHLIQIKYQIKNKGVSIFDKTITQSSSENDINLYLSIYGFEDHPTIRIDHMPVHGKGLVGTKQLQQSRTSSTIFSGTREINGNFSNRSELLLSEKLLSNIQSVKEGIFQTQYIAESKDDAPLSIDFSLEVNLVPSE